MESVVGCLFKQVLKLFLLKTENMTHKFILLLLLLCGGRAFSQTNEDSWSGFVTSEGLYQSGNTNKFLIQARGEVKREKGILELILAGTVGYGESKNVKDDNYLGVAFTADLFYESTVSPFFLQLFDYNFAKGIDLRSQTGAGAKYTFVHDPLHLTSASLALVYDQTDLAQKPGNFDAYKYRLSFRSRTRQTLLDSNLLIGYTFFYQPALNDFASYNIRFDSYIDVPVTKRLFLRASYLYTFEDVVSVGRKRADNKLTFGIGVGFF